MNSLLSQQFIIGLIAFAIAAALTPVVRGVALRWKLGDKPNGRKIATDMIPHLGGVAMIVGFVGALAVGYAWFDLGAVAWPHLIKFYALPIGIIVVLGLVDDMKSLGAIHKLVFQVVSGALLVGAGLSLATGVSWLDAGAVSVVFTLVFFVGMSSAVNLIDGHDGLAAGVMVIAAAAFAVLARQYGLVDVTTICIALAGVCLGFLLFNFPPGKIYMGDNGSMFLGTLAAITACRVSMVEPSGFVFAGICLILGVPMLDVFLAIGRRFALREPVFAADSRHIHHLLNEFGFSPRQTVAVVYAMQGFLSVLGVLTVTGGLVPLSLGIAFVAVTYVSFLRVMVATRRASAVVPVEPRPAHPAVTAKNITPLKTNIRTRETTTVGR